MLLMRDADLWQDVSDWLMRACGKRCGNWCAALMEIAAGETDMSAQRLDFGDDQSGLTSAEKAAAKRHSLIVSRMVASQAVASEFVITAGFLTVTVAQYVLDAGDVNRYRRSILPQPADQIAEGCDPCVCDLDGKISGQWSSEDGGCVEREIVHGRKSTYATPPLCRVPKQCESTPTGAEAILNATTLLTNLTADAEREWEQPDAWKWRGCTVGELASDDCDPEGDQARDTALAFFMVFLAQISAILLGKVILAWKTKRLVIRNNRSRVAATYDHALNRLATNFIAQSEMAQKHNDTEKKSLHEGKMSAKARFRRAVIASKFSTRISREADRAESVEDLMLDISTAVANHWKQARMFFVSYSDSYYLCR
eukprot:SAG11_NODE_1492_length_4807_cov_2.686703_4_plen_369_part_00